MQSWQKLLKKRHSLSEKSIEYQNLIEARLLAAYTRIRTSVRNGLAVFLLRGASAGSFFTIPPQTQVEIASRKNYYG
jgi:predicted  nucleic acid-binding Zn-ribbon protein